MSDLLGKRFRKQRTRVKEKLLEGLGKAKATQDDVFDQHASNLVKQTKACERLYRDLKTFGTALKSLVNAQKTLRETIRDLYEAEWPEREHLCAITQSLDLQWDEFEKTVNDQLVGSVNAYMAQLPPLKEKVAKRGRKLVDYDGARNTYTAIKASKRGEDDPKVIKAASDFEQAKALYTEINTELLDALPAAYDSRITFFVDTLQTLFNAESSNHLECAKYNKTLVTHLDSLGNSFDSLRVLRPESASSSQHDERSVSPTPSTPVPSAQTAPPVPTPLPRRSSSVSGTSKPVSKEETASEEKVENRVYPVLNPEDTSVVKKVEPKPLQQAKDEAKGSKASLNPFEEDEEEEGKDSTNPFEESDDDQEENVPVATARSMEKAADKSESEVLQNRKVLYKVRATHHYAAEDTDELTFDAGEVITVLESREEDQLDDGWLLGVKQSDGVRGVFPANFTKPL